MSEISGLENTLKAYFLGYTPGYVASAMVNSRANATVSCANLRKPFSLHARGFSPWDLCCHFYRTCVTVSNCKGCTICLFGRVEQVIIQDCSACRVLAWAVSGPVLARSCVASIIYTAAKQLRASACSHCIFAAHVPTSPILEDCQQCHTTAAHVRFPGAPELLDAAGIDASVSAHQAVIDLSASAEDLTARVSENWLPLDPTAWASGTGLAPAALLAAARVFDEFDAGGLGAWDLAAFNAYAVATEEAPAASEEAMAELLRSVLQDQPHALDADTHMTVWGMLALWQVAGAEAAQAEASALGLGEAPNLEWWIPASKMQAWGAPPELQGPAQPAWTSEPAGLALASEEEERERVGQAIPAMDAPAPIRAAAAHQAPAPAPARTQAAPPPAPRREVATLLVSAAISSVMELWAAANAPEEVDADELLPAQIRQLLLDYLRPNDPENTGGMLVDQFVLALQALARAAADAKAMLAMLPDQQEVPQDLLAAVPSHGLPAEDINRAVQGFATGQGMIDYVGFALSVEVAVAASRASAAAARAGAAHEPAQYTAASYLDTGATLYPTHDQGSASEASARPPRAPVGTGRPRRTSAGQAVPALDESMGSMASLSHQTPAAIAAADEFVAAWTGTMQRSPESFTQVLRAVKAAPSLSATAQLISAAGTTNIDEQDQWISASVVGKALASAGVPVQRRVLAVALLRLGGSRVRLRMQRRVGYPSFMQSHSSTAQPGGTGGASAGTSRRSSAASNSSGAAAGAALAGSGSVTVRWLVTSAIPRDKLVAMLRRARFGDSSGHSVQHWAASTRKAAAAAVQSRAMQLDAALSGRVPTAAELPSLRDGWLSKEDTAKLLRKFDILPEWALQAEARAAAETWLSGPQGQAAVRREARAIAGDDEDAAALAAASAKLAHAHAASVAKRVGSVAGTNELLWSYFQDCQRGVHGGDWHAWLRARGDRHAAGAEAVKAWRRQKQLLARAQAMETAAVADVATVVSAIEDMVARAVRPSQPGDQGSVLPAREGLDVARRVRQIRLWAAGIPSGSSALAAAPPPVPATPVDAGSAEYSASFESGSVPPATPAPVPAVPSSGSAGCGTPSSAPPATPPGAPAAAILPAQLPELISRGAYLSIMRPVLTSLRAYGPTAHAAKAALDIAPDAVREVEAQAQDEAGREQLWYSIHPAAEHGDYEDQYADGVPADALARAVDAEMKQRLEAQGWYAEPDAALAAARHAARDKQQAAAAAFADWQAAKREQAAAAAEAAAQAADSARKTAAARRKASRSAYSQWRRSLASGTYKSRHVKRALRRPSGGAALETRPDWQHVAKLPSAESEQKPKARKRGASAAKRAPKSAKPRKPKTPSVDTS